MGAEDPDIDQGGSPQRQIEAEGARELAQNDLRFGHRRSQENFDRAAPALLGEEAHGDDRHEKQREPGREAVGEEIEERLILRGAGLVQNREDDREDVTVQEQEGGQDHPRERREKVSAPLAAHDRQKLSHDASGTSEAGGGAGSAGCAAGSSWRAGAVGSS